MQVLFPLALLIGCNGDSDDVVVIVDQTTVTLELRNPTEDADPFDSVTSLRIDVVADGTVVASDSFSYPDEATEMQHVSEYGAIRFEVAGIASGEVVSYGRSAEVAIPEDEDLGVPITFLPVNRVFALEEEMNSARSEHAALRLRDGRVLLVGGHNFDRSRSFDDLEIFDPYDWNFTVPGAYLEEALAAPRYTWLDDGRIMFIGGETLSGPQAGGTTAVHIYDPVEDEVERPLDLAVERYEHCAAHYLPSGVLVLGGPGTGSIADQVLRPDDGGDWYDREVTLRDDLVSEDVTGCIADEDGRVFVQGNGPTTTGIWDITTSSNEPGQAFTPIEQSYSQDIFVENALIRFLDLDDGDGDGIVWIAGGTVVSSSEVVADGREFRMDSESFVETSGLSVARQSPSWDEWIEEGWIVVGCGFSDASGTQSANSVELLNPVDGEATDPVTLDRTRLGCQVTTLLDGSILITGGYDSDFQAGDAGVGIMVPYLGD